MVDTDDTAVPSETSSLLRLGVVEFLNTQPIIAGLDVLQGVELKHAVPSRLVELLESSEVDAALCSSIDYHQAKCDPVILPAPPLGCDGATHTVRLFARSPLDTIDRVHCDSDSHTSVVLLQVVMQERYGRRVEILPFDASARSDWPDAVLLIGDKVVAAAPEDAAMPHQLDLGEAWKELTGLPFIFGIWLGRADGDQAALRLASDLLERQYRYNRMHLEGILARVESERNWPIDVADQYLRESIRYEFGPAQRAGLERFYELAGAHEFIRLREPVRWLDH
ncbi:MAG TPA: hypothetical protein DEO57_05210 [Phycisphaerales bacterium]|nr:hypothetical protein [Phycisphaerales bacterium]